MMIKSLNKFYDLIPWQQLFRFGVVGVSAAIVHFCLVVCQVEVLGFVPLAANIFAFLCAFFVSYFGHKYWTFSSTLNDEARMLHFFIVAFASFLLNESLFFVFLTTLHLHYTLALFLVLIIVPPLTFVASKLWAFKA